MKEFLKQISLYKLNINQWKIYENEFEQFKESDHLKAQAPVPPDARTLILHVFLKKSGKVLSEIKNIFDLVQNDIFHECFKAAKRRLHICACRIVDQNVFLNMLEDLK